ncbi:MAG TPA: hypothetical protein VN641_13555, partial [Urbifossiella sp.]|nr:hypothetical protein [Urbifossiella sp.]
MSDIAIIITAAAGLVTALAAVVAASSKLGPVLTVFNKMLADQHKRAKELRKEAANQKTISTAQPTAEAPESPAKPGDSTPGSGSGDMPPDIVLPFPKWWVLSSLCLSMIGLLLTLISTAPPTQSTVAGCTVNAIVFIVAVLFSAVYFIVKLLFLMYCDILRCDLKIEEVLLEADSRSTRVILGLPESK